MNLEVIILAAGQGSRMRSAIPKVLHRLGPWSLLEHVVRLAKSLSPVRMTVVYGHGGDRVRADLSHLDVDWVEQKERLGTGHAVRQVEDRIGTDSMVLILYGDVPLLRQDTVGSLLNCVDPAGASCAVLTVNLADPSGYGRIIRNEAGQMIRIVEDRDCRPCERSILEGNTGIMAVHGGSLKNWLSRLENRNAQGEYYLTDVIGFAVEDGVSVKTATASGVDEVLGVNNRQQLAHLERVYQRLKAEELMAGGVTLRDPDRIDVRCESLIYGEDIELDVNVVLEGCIDLGARVRIGPQVWIRNSVIGDEVEILAGSVIEGAHIERGSRIGPMARLRPGTRLKEGVHVGNFVEIKNSSIDSGSKVNHLSYVGDAEIGVGVNIGAGTITCNYDGVNKSKTIIEDGVFIGSNTQLIAPVRVGRGATVGAGSTITRDVPEDRLTLSRSKQVTVEGWRRPSKAGKEG